jgi:hypothetical protein
LHHLRKADQKSIIWIDALAINQADIPERNAQVPKMPTIYTLAASTVIWLGPKDEFDEKVAFIITMAGHLSAIQPVSEYSREEIIGKRIAELDMDEVGGIIVALAEFMDCPYWYRVWVVQEIMYSHHVLLMYGSHFATYEGISHLYRVIPLLWNSILAKLDR